ncbi:MAG: 2-C-methyl-D-erythritol 2,4-cyclodiphosphate synthase, partial [Kiritimatiellae bacterium]|nr:2-C-methyl-D-erythritol 2,4-cyclodiphosphate synthase [Kiritimatiellia bacterium]
WRGADSGELLRAAVYEVRGAGYAIENVDATVICERPKLRPFVDLMRSTLAGFMGVGIGRVSVKGKTNEKMDDVGAGRGIVVHAVALLRESKAE